MSLPDRRALLLAQAAITGMDFVTVAPDQRALTVHFIVPPPAALEAGLTAAQVLLTPEPDLAGEVRPMVTGLAWDELDGVRVLRIALDQPGGFGLYRLRLAHPLVDPYFNGPVFDFKVDCPAERDCAPAEPGCPEEDLPAPVIDYRARDFDSFRTALMDFASVAHPGWQDRREADAGVMVAELLAALGDEFAWYQDRIMREAYLGTAQEPRSLREHARLLDYEPDDGAAAFAWLEATGGAAVLGLPAGTVIRAQGDNGVATAFAIGRSLAEIEAGAVHDVDPAIAIIPAHVWDEDDTCLHAGATSVVVRGHWRAALPLIRLAEDGTPYRDILLRTDPADPALPARRLAVRLVDVIEGEDPLATDAAFGTAVSTLVLDPAAPTPFDLDLETLTARGNLLPATAGDVQEAWFAIGDPALLAALPAEERARIGRTVEREGPAGATIHRYTLPGSEALPLAFRDGVAEVALVEMRRAGNAWVTVDDWEWRRALIGAVSSLPEDRHVTVEAGAWRRVWGSWRGAAEVIHEDYAGPAGATLRFGDGQFAVVPAAGTVFRVRYRLGNGLQGNLPADSIRHADAPADAFAWTNPLPAGGGREPESAASIRTDAPEAFRHDRLFAVRRPDHAQAAERLAWVSRAGETRRWTGSWPTVFVTPDPRDAVELAPARALALEAHLDRFRQAGVPVQVPDPAYADLDIEARICVRPDAFPDPVRRAVRAALVGPGGVFDPEAFTFGTRLDRSRLEAAIQTVPGVKAVEGLRIRRRGFFDWKPLPVGGFAAGPAELIRVVDDPRFPRRGSLTLLTEGGA